MKVELLKSVKNGNALNLFKIFFVAVFSRMQRPFLNLTFNAKKHDFDANLHLSAFFKVKQGLSVPSDFIFFENGNGNHAFLHFVKIERGFHVFCFHLSEQVFYLIFFLFVDLARNLH